MLGWKLAANGLPAKVLTGDVSQERRQKIIDGMKSGNVKMLVATDVAARGLHIDGITHVINYDLPEDAANYVHRIGRTARAGKSGKAYNLACEDHVLNLPEIEKYIERKIEKEWIETSEMAKDTAPEYNYGKISREKGFERKGGKPHGAERRGKTVSQQHSKDSPKEREKQGDRKKKGPQQTERIRKSTGAELKTERATRGKGMERPGPGNHRPIDRRMEISAKTEPNVAMPQPAPEIIETGPIGVKEKEGILNSFFKKILKWR